MEEIFWKLLTPKNVFPWIQKAPVSEHPSGVKNFAGPKRCSNLHGIPFIVIFL